MTPPRFRVCGTIKGDPDETVHEMQEVSLCFLDANEAARFMEFAGECARDMKEAGEDWDHEHYFPDLRDEGHADIILARLYPSNYGDD